MFSPSISGRLTHYRGKTPHQAPETDRVIQPQQGASLEYRRLGRHGIGGHVGSHLFHRSDADLTERSTYDAVLAG